MATRPYSRDFTPVGPSHRYLLDRIPRPLWRAVRQKAKQEQVSLRHLVLRLLTEWLRDERA